MASSRLAVMPGSFWRRLPAAELRGLAKRRSPASSWRRFSSSNAASGMYTSPRTSSRVGRAGGEALGHDADGANVGGDVLADAAVAAGGGLDEAAALVGERHGEAVDLQLGDERGAGIAEPRCDAAAPRHQLRLVEGVVEALHRHPVRHLGERRRGSPAGTLRGRVRRDEVGVLLLQGAQLADQRVELGVGDGRLVEIEVAMLMLADLGPEPVDAGDGVVDARRRGHHDHGSHGLMRDSPGNTRHP